jgi:hypothetical protein
LIVSQALSKEGEVAEVVHRWNNARNVGLGEEVIQSRLDVATGIDLVVSELLTSGSADDVFASILRGCGGSCSPLPLVTKIASFV